MKTLDNSNTDEQFNIAYKTRDYGKFKTHPSNRKHKPAKVEALVKLMKRYGWLLGSYIIVDKNFVIINGQHRFLAAQILGIPVFYIREDVVTTAQLIRDNNLHHMSWSLEDTLNGFVAEGSPNYLELNDFKNQFPKLKFTDVMMFAKVATRSAYRHELEDGTFKMKDRKTSEIWGNYIKKFTPYIDEKECYSRQFTMTLAQIWCNPLIDFDELLAKVEKYPYMLRNYKQVDRNLEMFEKIYNKGKHLDKRVPFKKIVTKKEK